MHRTLQRAGRVCIVCVMLAGVLISSGVQLLTPSSVAAQSVHSYYFPWAPHEETVNGQGPWFSKLSFQNLSDDLCSVSIMIGHDGTWMKTAQLTVGGKSARSISSRSMGIPAPGASLRLDAFCPISASIKIVTPDINRTPWSDGAHVVTGYTGLADADMQAANEDGTYRWFLPIVQTNSNWNSIIRLTNFQRDRSVTARVRLYSAENLDGAGGPVREVTRTIEVGDSAVVNVLDELQIPGWVGFAEIEADGVVGAYTLRSKPGASMALINVAAARNGASSVGEYRLAAPLLFTAYNDWNTGINLANVSEQTANITITYHAAAGEAVRTEEVELPPYSMRYLYTPASVDQMEFVGSASIESNTPVLAAIDEVKYTSVDAISYLASGIGQQDAATPLVFRSDPEQERHDNSGLNIQNMNPDEAQTVTIDLLGSGGEPLLDAPLQLSLPPGGNNFIYVPEFDEISAGTVMSAHIRSSDPFGFVALANDVNYRVSGDGSTTFLLTGSQGYFHIPAAPLN